MPQESQQIVLSRGLTDSVKFLAATAVAMCHFSADALEVAENPIYRFFATHGGSVGVALFFFLSGYGLMMSDRRKHLSFLEFVKRRLVRVYLPVVFVTAVWGIVVWPAGDGVAHLPEYLYSVFWTFSDGILWFVKAILLLYLFFYAYSTVRLRISPVLRLLALIVGTAVAYYLVYHLFAGYCAISVPFFALGVVLVEFNEKVYAVCHSYKLVLWLVGITAILGACYLAWGNLYAHALGNWYLVTMLVALCAWRQIDFSLPVWVGGCSYDIYLTHHKVQKFLQPIYGNIPLHHFLVGVVICVAASYSLRKLLRI